MSIQPVPDLVLASEFPTNADRTAGVWNARAAAWANSENAMATSVRNISSVTWNNANEVFGLAVAANQSKIDAEAFKNQAQGYANSAGNSAAVVGRWDKLVLGPKSTPPTVDNDGQPLLVGAEYYNTVLKARYSWNGTAWAIGTNVTAGVASVDGMTGTVVLDKGSFVYSRPNKIPNASFARSFEGWAMYSDTGRTDWVLQDVAQGLKAAMLLNVQGIVALSVSQLPVVAGRQYDWTAETFFSGATGGVTRLYVEWFDAGNAYISSSYGPALGVSNYPVDYANRQANLAKATAPANAVYARLAFWAGTLTGPANVGIHRPKFQESAPGINSPMLFTDEATISLLGQASGARGQQKFTASQTINKSIFGLATYVWVEGWSGGDAGIASVSASSATGSGGRGGDYGSALIRVADLPETIDIVIGAGGLGGTTTSATPAGGNPGGSTSFGALLVVPGGNQRYAGRRGGVPANNSSGGTDINAMDAGAAGGSAFVAGTTAAGTSLRGGNGGAGVVTEAGTAAVGNAGAAPGGGGGGARVNSSTGTATSGAGARGELRIKWW